MPCAVSLLSHPILTALYRIVSTRFCRKFTATCIFDHASSRTQLQLHCIQYIIMITCQCKSILSHELHKSIKVWGVDMQGHLLSSYSCGFYLNDYHTTDLHVYSYKKTSACATLIKASLTRGMTGIYDIISISKASVISKDPCGT
jgi:hypothetical protein